MTKKGPALSPLSPFLQLPHVSRPSLELKWLALFFPLSIYLQFIL
jgi:hypothetical protein